MLLVPEQRRDGELVTRKPICIDRSKCRNRDTWHCAHCTRNPSRPTSRDYLDPAEGGIVEMPVMPGATWPPEARDQEELVLRPRCCAALRRA